MASNDVVSRQASLKDIIPASTRLRHLLNDTNRLIVCPGVYDGLSTRIAIDVGFDALYMVRASELFCLYVFINVGRLLTRVSERPEQAQRRHERATLI